MDNGGRGTEAEMIEGFNNLKAENEELKTTFNICDKERLRHLLEKADVQIQWNKEVNQLETEKKQLENLIRDMLFDIPVIPDRYKYVNRLKEIVK